jgi:hypothetical protein
MPKVPRSVHEAARDKARAIAKTEAYVVSCRERKKVEMLFAHLKRILRLDRLRLRGPNGARDEFLLAATAQNLRKFGQAYPRTHANLRQMRRRRGMKIQSKTSEPRLEIGKELLRFVPKPTIEYLERRTRERALAENSPATFKLAHYPGDVRLDDDKNRTYDARDVAPRGLDAKKRPCRPFNAAKNRRRGQSRLRRGLADVGITVANPNLGRDRGV